MLSPRQVVGNLRWIFAVAFLAFVSVSRADINQWEYVNPADPSQGKQPSATVCPGGTGVTAQQGANLQYRDLNHAYLINADLTLAYMGLADLSSADLSDASLAVANLESANLSDATLRNAILVNADLDNANLTGADFTGAIVRGASFGRYYNSSAGISLTQLYSTASYQSQNLTGIGLAQNDLTDADFSNQNMSAATLYQATLDGANFSQADLTGASFDQASLTGAIFTGAKIKQADFSRNGYDGPGGLTIAQLTSSASYSAHDLSGIQLSFNQLAGVNLSQQNLTGALFGGATLSGADFTGANLSQAVYGSAALDGAIFTNATIRGASLVRDPTFGLGGLTVNQLYSTVSYQSHDLSGIDFTNNLLAGADLSNQNLTSVNFDGADLTGVNFSGATITLDNFDDAHGFTKEQLYTTVDYQAHHLANIGFSHADFTDANLADQDLSDARLSSASLVHANLHGANLSGAFAESADFSGSDLGGANLLHGFFYSADFTGANLAGATIAGGTFWPSITGIGSLTAAQIYSTASYQNHDLHNISLPNSVLPGVNFAGQNLSNAYLGYAMLAGATISHANLKGAVFNNADLTGADFSHSNLANADFFSAHLAGANFTAADTRGAYALDLTGTIATNTIRPDGHISGLDLSAGQQLVVRNYQSDFGIILIGRPILTAPVFTYNVATIGDVYTGDPILISWPIFPPPISITVDQHLQMGSGGSLKFLLDGDYWGSTISFAHGISVAIGGSLDLEFADGVDPSTQVGRDFHLFDWTGVTPTGSFAIDGLYTWDLSNLYTTGEIVLVSVPEPASLLLLAAGAFSLSLLRSKARLSSSRRCVVVNNACVAKGCSFQVAA